MAGGAEYYAAETYDTPAHEPHAAHDIPGDPRLTTLLPFDQHAF